MTTTFPETVKCSVCGAENETMVVVSTNAFGPTDLDTRPPEMKRSTMCYWVQECDACGYAATDLTDETSLDRSFFETEAYQSCDGISFKSDLAKSFYRHYLIMTAEERHEDAFWAALHAAWSCDDKKDRKNAALMREKAVEQADLLLQYDGCDWKDTVRLIRADLLRRTGRFDELLKQYESAAFDGELLNAIIVFEKELARRKLSGCFTVADAQDYAKGSFEWPEE